MLTVTVLERALYYNITVTMSVSNCDVGQLF